ncbi:spore germination protein [Paenibacillus sp. FSL H8-0332]|uniref:spore germination protein n=1 Tax=Paenibacillus sp. FSL H8-0332 TaxID=2954742 RepID=UPI0030D37425
MNTFWRKKLSMKYNQSEPKPQVQPPALNDPLTGILEQDLLKIKETFKKSNDVLFSEFNLGINEAVRAAIIYTDGLADTTIIQNSILDSLMHETSQMEGGLEGLPTEFLYRWIKKRSLTVGAMTELTDFDSLYTSVLSGNTVILFDRFVHAISVNTPGWDERGVSEPESQTVVRGPRDGFCETLRTNTALVRRRIKNAKLFCEPKQIGRLTKTDLAVMYIQGVANDKVIQEVHERLDRIDIDGILESGNIEELIQDETYTPFPTVYNTERPDVVAAALLEGRVAIMIDGTPFVLLVPALFIQSLQSAEDYYQRSDVSSLIRILRYLCFLIALLGPSIYIALTTFHQEMLPTPLLISLAAQREGVPFPAFVEALVMEVTFEILREAGIRMPRAVGQAVSIVGALVIGQASVEAGIVSAAMVIVVSITAIASFVIPAFNMAISVRMLRFVMMALAASFGLYGITLGLLALLLHLNSLRSFGIPYMAPLSPYIADDQKDSILRFPLKKLLTRPRLISPKNRTREESSSASKPKSNQ